MKAHFIRFFSTILGVVLLLVSSGCGVSGQSETPKLSDDEVTLRFSYWGSDQRAKLQDKVISAFEKKYPRIRVEADVTNYDDYVTKLATASSAADLPDVFTYIDPFGYDYTDYGQLYDLRQLSEWLDLTEFPADSFSDVTGQQGEKYGVSLGVSGHGIIVNPAVFQRFGVDIPDDSTWTWEDFEKAANSISQASGGSVRGFNIEMTENMAHVWLRQHGQTFGEGKDGDPAVDCTAKGIASFFSFQEKLVKDGATNPPDQAQELYAAGTSAEQSLIGQDKAGMAVIAMAQLGQFEAAAGHEMIPVLWPGEHEFTQPGGWTKQGTWIGVSANSAHPAEAALFINYLVNNVDAAKIMGFDRGVPANKSIANKMKNGLSDSDQRMLNFIERSQSEDQPIFKRQNSGAASILTEAFNRANETVLFKKSTPEQAGKKLLNELNISAS